MSVIRNCAEYTAARKRETEAPSGRWGGVLFELAAMSDAEDRKTRNGTGATREIRQAELFLRGMIVTKLDEISWTVV
jgi:hypothetical protein